MSLVMIYEYGGIRDIQNTGVPEYILSTLEINFIISTLKIMSNRNLFSI